MFGFGLRSRQSAAGGDTPNSIASPVSTASPRSVGEIDTSAPFQSVKAAVSLFGEASPKTKPVHKRSQSSLDERVLEKETQHHLTLKELGGLKEQLRSLESSKAQALRDLDIAKRTLEKLTNKLDTLSESKQAAIVAAEEAKRRLTELEEKKRSRAQLGPDAWKVDVDNERNRYKASAAELSSAKQELTNLRQDFDAALVAKVAAFQEAADVQHNTQESLERASGLSEELSQLSESLSQIKLVSQQARDEHKKIIAEKETQIQNYKTAKEEIEKKITSINEELESGLNQNFEENLEETKERIAVLQEQLNNFQASDVELLRSINLELQSAKKELQEIEHEENLQRSLVHSLTQELESVKEYSESEKASSEADAANENLHVDLRNSKKGLEAINAEEAEAEILKKNAEVFRQEAEAAGLATRENEELLRVALEEAEKAKESQKLADDEIKNLSRTVAADAADGSENKGKKIRLTAEQFDELSKRVEKSKADTDVKIATTKAQVEIIRANEEEALKRLAASRKEFDDLKAAIEDASKQAEMAEAAKQVVEGELRRWRGKEVIA